MKGFAPIPGGAGIAPNLSGYSYFYSMFFDDVANAASSTQSVNIQADANFLVQAMIFACYNAAAIVAAPLATILLTDASSGMQLSDRALPLPTLFGTAQLPMLLPTPRIFPASSTINGTLTNNDGGARDFWIVFAGMKISQLRR